MTLRLLPGLPVPGWRAGEEREVSPAEAQALFAAYPARFVEVRGSHLNRMLPTAQVTKWR